MRKIFLTIFFLIVSFLTFGSDLFIDGYYRSDGTYVKPHYRSRADNSFQNNYSSYGNTNPYTGKKGYKREKSSGWSSGGSSGWSSGGSSGGSSGWSSGGSKRKKCSIWMSICK